MTYDTMTHLSLPTFHNVMMFSPIPSPDAIIVNDLPTHLVIDMMNVMSVSSVVMTTCHDDH